MNRSSPFTSPAYNYLPAAIVDQIPRLGETAEIGDPLLYIKLFMSDGRFTWYIAERDPETEICFGFVVGPCPEWGDFDLNEIRQVRGYLKLPVERDLHFDPCPSSKITSQL